VTVNVDGTTLRGTRSTLTAYMTVNVDGTTLRGTRSTLTVTRRSTSTGLPNDGHVDVDLDIRGERRHERENDRPVDVDRWIRAHPLDARSSCRRPAPRHNSVLPACRITRARLKRA